LICQLDSKLFSYRMSLERRSSGSGSMVIPIHVSTFQIFFYVIRPMFVIAQPLTALHYLNILVQFVINYFLVAHFGFKPLDYLLFSSFLAGSLHPCAGHFIAEHYILSYTAPKSSPDNSVPIPEETFSYYGPLN